MTSTTVPGMQDPGSTIPEAQAQHLVAKIAEHETELIAFRRRLHSEPELSFAEVATTDAIQERLALEGLDPQRLESGTGLFCDIGAGEPLVALRAEIDALAMDDIKDVPYRSRTPGVAHACGHDAHTAAALGAAIALKSLADLGQLPGRVRMIYEPGEESVPVGSVEIVEAGLLDGVGMIFALHCDPKQLAGSVGARLGPITSAYDRLEITITGPGGHTARPELTVNLIDVAARAVIELPGAMDDRVGGPGTCRFVFGSFHGGSAANVIPTTVKLGASLRTQDVAAWRTFPEELPLAIEQVLGPTGASWNLEHLRGVPPVVNDSTALGVMTSTAEQLIGPGIVTEKEHSWGGDSFGWMTEATRGAFLRLGTHKPGSGEQLDLHSALFDVDEGSIAIGAKILAGSAVSGLILLSLAN